MQFVEYIQNGTGTSTTSAYMIDLGYYPTSNTKVELEISSENELVGEIFGSYLTSGQSDGKMWRLFGYRGITFDCPKDGNARVSVDFNLNTRQTITTWISDGKAYLENSTTSQTVSGNMPSPINNNDLSFKLWTNAYTNASKCGLKVYGIKIYESNVLQMDLRPAVNNNTAGLYDVVTMSFYQNSLSGVLEVGPVLSTIGATYTGSSIASTGGTASIEVVSDYVWTASTSDTWVTLSTATGDTGITTITATFAANSGNRRVSQINFVNATGDTDDLSITQKKVAGAGTPFYLGGDEITECYLGGDAISEAYLGEDLVYSSGPFVGLKTTPKSLDFSNALLEQSLKIKSSENWTLTAPQWISTSVSTGSTGETMVGVSATTQTSATSGSIVVTSANYSASVLCDYIIGTPKLRIDGTASIPTSFSPYNAYTGQSNYLKCEISAEWSGTLSSGAYLYACGPSVPFFSCERFRTSDRPYCNIGDGKVSNGPTNGGGLDHTWVFEVNDNAVSTYLDGQLTETQNISGSWPLDNLSFAQFNAENLHIDFYSMKFFGANNTLLAEFMPDPSGGIIDRANNVLYPKTGTGTTSYSLVVTLAND